jgi:hypothetical protein
MSKERRCYMKSSIAKAIAATAIGLITATSAGYASDQPGRGSTMGRIEQGTAHVARTTWRDSKGVARTTVSDSKGFAAATWDGSKRVARTAIDSPVIAWQVVRGERPLFPHETAARGQGRREQIALTGHRSTSHKEMSEGRPPI